MASLGGIKIERRGIGGILRDFNVRVPVYQRSYQWKKEHVEDMFQEGQFDVSGSGGILQAKLVPIHENA